MRHLGPPVLTIRTKRTKIRPHSREIQAFPIVVLPLGSQRLRCTPALIAITDEVIEQLAFVCGA